MGHYVKHRNFLADEPTAVAAGQRPCARRIHRPCARCMPAEYAA